jgi:hypothetical protein
MYICVYVSMTLKINMRTVSFGCLFPSPHFSLLPFLCFFFLVFFSFFAFLVFLDILLLRPFIWHLLSSPVCLPSSFDSFGSSTSLLPLRRRSLQIIHDLCHMSMGDIIQGKLQTDLMRLTKPSRGGVAIR